MSNTERQFENSTTSSSSADTKTNGVTTPAVCCAVLAPSDLTGRKRIYTDEKVVTEENIERIINETFPKHLENKTRIEFLEKYSKGVQPIINRVKEVRPEINFKVVENHAAEIVNFKTGYVFGSPISFVQRASADAKGGAEEKDDKGISLLNEMMFAESKSTKDQKLARNFFVTGLGYKMALPNKTEKAFSPFKIYTLKPATTYVVYTNDIEEKDLLGVSYSVKDNGDIILGAYSDTHYYELKGTGTQFKLVKKPRLNGITVQPIVEYTSNYERQGAFENVIPLLDALNNSTSDRMNGLAQFVQAILWLNNCEIDEDQMAQLKDKLGLLTKSEPGNTVNAEYLTATLNQTETQTLVDFIYETVLTIAGVPGRNASSGQNTGQAVILDQGWRNAESMAKTTETIFEEAERKFLNVVLKIIEADKNAAPELKSVSISDIDIKFTRNKTDSLLVKTQALQQLIDTGIHPRIAIDVVGLFNDTQQVYIDSKPYLEKRKEEKNNPSKQKGVMDNNGLSKVPTETNVEPVGE